jgi:tRNA nucleotidyltransferase (CCA-adding enzyme)
LFPIIWRVNQRGTTIRFIDRKRVELKNSANYRKLIETLKNYIVGGYVRDHLLGLDVKDRDWVVIGAKDSDMLASGYKRVGKDFPVYLHPQTKEEYALARTERKVAPGYKGFIFDANQDVSLEQDLQRRDLTINAIAMDESGNMLDPFGGRKDLQQRVLRHVSNAFSEDPVRILRVARFAARFAHLGFQVADSTMTLMCEMVESGEVDALVPERVWGEFEKALKTAHPSQFIQVLRRCGALATLFPDIDNLFGIPQPILHHPEIDCGIHTLSVLQQACLYSEDPVIRFAALTHDLGKGATPAENWPKHHQHEERSVQLLTHLCQRYPIANEYRELALAVAKHHGNCHRAFELKPSTIINLFYELDVWRRPNRLPAFLLACKADSRGRAGHEHRPYPQETLLLDIFNECKAIDTNALNSQGFTGQKFGNELRKLRVNAAKKILQKMHCRGAN